MPQTTAEKKFFSLRADNFFHDKTLEISKNTITARFEQYKGFLKKITGGEA
ncbi:hypothetical protein [Myxosarcina sp. GI1]|uniref:hypothetical protein n=1 Tax=Myxosarcina sp. GI1 TaxID=1541065 RepID=UPI0012E0647A|nr:hypothetical protein [Myxosarcina sp. GI1]